MIRGLFLYYRVWKFEPRGFSRSGIAIGGVARALSSAAYLLVVTAPWILWLTWATVCFPPPTHRVLGLVVECCDRAYTPSCVTGGVDAIVGPWFKINTEATL